MDKSLSQARADRMFRLFSRMSRRFEDLGLARQQIEDFELSDARVTIHGKTLANFGLASYLALGTDDRLVEAAKKAMDRYGTSYSSSVSYTSIPLYGELDERLSAIFGSEVVIAPTTTLAHLAALPVLVHPQDTVVLDTRVHASVRAAAQILEAGGVNVHVSPHNDMDDLERFVVSHSEGAVWYLTDGVFSMDGDTAPAADIHRLLEGHEHFHAYIDDAHGFSWAGKQGRGTYLDRVPWHERVVVSAGLSKSFGATGGVIATRDPDLARSIRITGGPLVFGGPLPPAALGAAIASADIHLSNEHVELRAELDQRIDFVNRFATEIGLRLTAFDHTPVWFLETSDVGPGTALLVAMKEAGFYLNGAVFPVVPHGHAGARFSVTLYHSLSQIEAMLTCLHEKALEHLGETEVVIDLDRIAAEDKELSES